LSHCERKILLRSYSGVVRASATKSTNILGGASGLDELTVFAAIDRALEDGLASAYSVVRDDDGDIALAAHETAVIGAVHLGVVDGTGAGVNALPKALEIKEGADVGSAETTKAGGGSVLLSGEGRRGGSESAKDSGSGELHDGCVGYCCCMEYNSSLMS